MKVFDLFEETYSAIVVNKVRTGLTILGIVIGIASVIAMIAIGQGAQVSIQSSIQSIGSNLIIVMPGFQRGVGNQVSAGRGGAQTLTQEDSDAIKKEISNIKDVSPELSRRYQITTKGKNTNTQVMGVTPSYLSVRNAEVQIGSFITESLMRQSSKVAVIGPTTRDDLFGEGVDPVGQNLRINRIDFKIIGVMKSKGGSGFGNQDDMIYVPITTAQKFLSGDTYVSSISVQAQTAEDMLTVQEDITSLLMVRHKITNPQALDFSVLNQSDIVAAASSVTGIFTTLLASIAGISLLVGGIGIMNMMLTSVTERTREIGLRKSIGAKRSDINMQFLSEAIFLTFIGGLVGVLLGWLISYAVSSLANIATSISVTSVILAFGVSTVIGVVFGYYPARRASKLNPIEALRYE